MDDTSKAKLAAKLSGNKKFDNTYTKENRAWFARAVVEAVAAVKADADVEAEATRIITEANKRVAADRDFKIGVTLDTGETTLERRDTARRVETIYGVIARSTELADTSQDGLRKFLALRRYRTSVRMMYQVNPNSNGFFFYPDACEQPPPPGRGSWRTNIDTKDLWERSTVDQVPLRVRVPSGGAADPKSAAQKLWVAHNQDPCQSNLFDCAHGVSCVLMDSVSEAVDSDKMYKAIYSRGPNHLLIVNPNKFSGTHYLWEADSEPKKVFSKEKVPPADLQVGDHVYIWNHGLYPQLLPLGFWSGEHAILTSCGTRDLADGKGFLFSGHGLDNPTTVEALHDGLIKTLQTAMHRIYSIGSIFLAFRKSNDTSIPTTKVQRDLFQMTKPDGTQVDVLAYEIETDFKFGNYLVKPKRDGSPPMVTESSFVAFDIPALNVIGIAMNKVDTIADQRNLGIEKMTPLFRTGTPSGGGSNYEKSLWQIRYQDSDSGTDKDFPLFGGPSGALRLLTRKEMPKFKFGRLLATDTGALVTRPTSDPSSSYVSFLRTSGAFT